MGIFYPYQKEVFDDKSQFKLILKARQIGFSTEFSLEGVLDSYASNDLTIFVSAGERQSIELARKSKIWCEALLKIGVDLTSEKMGKKKHTVSTLSLDGGGRCMFFPSSPDTIRGFTGNVYLDEFAFHRDAHKVYQALFPMVAGGSYNLRIASTPAGESGKFFELWDENNSFSKHKIDIHTAISQRYKIDLDLIRENLDADSFAQEYECSFLAKSSVFIPRTLVKSCISERCRDLQVEPVEGSIFIGIDIARKNDLTVIFVLEYLGDVGYQRELIELSNENFDSQQTEICNILNRYGNNVVSCCIDQTGIGMQIAEETQKRYPGTVQPVTFTNETKKMMATDLKIDFENANVRIDDNAVLVSDITSVKKEVGSSGIIKYVAAHTEDGHADRFWSLALARYGRRGLVQAATKTVEPNSRETSIYHTERSSRWN